VEEHLIPRLNGFELLMASYAMAHLKLDMLLRETGYDREADQRFRVYLTNSLEEHHPDTGTLFAGWLSNEANEANHVKRDTPVMVVMGNPPYSVSSSNKGEWIKNLIADYKDNLDETTINSLSDDYVKFIRYGQHFVDQNGEGVLAYISNNSFLDGLIHRRMRESLMDSFDKIYILDLHGDSNKNEKTPEGNKDDNVFDIRQGVSISLFIKTGKNEESKVLHSDLFGSREEKYKNLLNTNIKSLKWNELNCEPPYYFFTQKDFRLRKVYEQFVSIESLFKERISGIETKRDDLFTDLSKNKLEQRIKKLITNNFDESFKKNFNVKNSSGYDLIGRIKDAEYSQKFIRPVNYRPFEKPYIYYDTKLLGRSMYSTMRNLIPDNNFGLVASKQCHRHFTFSFITDKIIDSNYLASAKKFGGGYVFPLYLYPEDDGQQTLSGRPERKPNLDPDIIQEIADGLGLRFVREKKDGVHLEGGPHLNVSEEGPHLDTFAPIDLLDYIYAVLHSPSYRDKYKEFLKIDFPRVPYPSDADTFWQLVELGGELRQIHLLEHPVVDDFITTYPEAGSNEITKRLTKTQPGFIPYKEDDNPLESTSKMASNFFEPFKMEAIGKMDSITFSLPDGGHSKSGLHQSDRYPNEPLGKVQINEKQYFGDVPEKAWNFYIGGYQPAEKWLKDRRDRELSFEEIQHYQKIIVALMETDQIMQAIDGIELE